MPTETFVCGKMRKICYEHDPERSHRWCAWDDNLPEDGPVGWGETQEAAFANLKQDIIDYEYEEE